jgi:hypothetical protein
MFPTFFTANLKRINLLFTQILDEKFKRYPPFTIQKDINIYKSIQEQIETIEKRKTLRAINKCEKKKENEEDSGIRSYKR